MLIRKNIQQTASFTLRHLLDIEEFAGEDFQLFVVGNETVSEGNAPILFAYPNFLILRFVALFGNSVQNTFGKGLVDIDYSYIGTKKIYAEDNNFVDPNFNAPTCQSATVPESLAVGYRSTIPTNPQLPLEACYWLHLN
ncbi:MAG: hypothetical protein VB018_11075 [Lachnospiraceae bacterium]|nr:hypothetical protein [Lachnospiraceae bacterium]